MAKLLKKESQLEKQSGINNTNVKSEVDTDKVKEEPKDPEDVEDRIKVNIK